MGFILRLPSITAPTNEEKIEQLRTYLYQTVKDIEFSLNAIDSNSSMTVEAKETDAQSMFAVLKPLIVRSSDIINAYYSIIKGRLDNFYVPLEEYNTHHMVVGNITSYPDECELGITNIATNNLTTGLPDGFTDAVGQVHKVINKTMIQLTDISTGKMASKSYVNGVWQDWKVINPE